MIDKNKYKKLSLRGGGAKGLVYLKFIKEIVNKNIYFEQISGCSAGGIFGACLACVRDPKKIYEIMLSLKGDKVMKWTCEAETGLDNNGNKICAPKRIIKGIGAIAFNFIPMNSIKRVFKKHFTWECVHDQKVNKLCIGVVKQKDLYKVLNKQAILELKKDGLNDLLNGKGVKSLKQPSIELIKQIPMYFFTNFGLYKKEYGKKPVLINRKTPPLWKVVLATFANPVLPAVYLKFDKCYAEKCFDGGVANNEANSMWTDNEYIQAVCDELPPKLTGKEKGLEGINTMYYNENKPDVKNELEIKTKIDNKKFFGFYDSLITENYKEAPTNFFK